MDKIKKNLPVILLSACCTLLLVIVIILLTNRNGFSFTNKSSNSETSKNNTKEIKKEDEKKKQGDNKEEVNNTVNTDNTSTTNSNSNNNSTSTYKEEKSESSLLSYFNEQSNLYTTNNNNSSMTSKLKDGFVSIIDFIFYDKEIKGYTFKELTNSAKLKIISIALGIDNKIDKYFPDYKENIKDKYDEYRGKLALKYIEVTSNFCSNDPNACMQAKEDFENMKESFGFAWDLLKELATSGGTKLKEFYEGWKDK